MKIALVQSPVRWGDVDENLRVFDQKLKGIKGCDLILLPEMFACGAMTVPVAGVARQLAAVAGRSEEIMEMMLRWAAEQDAAVIGSAVCGEDGKIYNRMVVAFPDGTHLCYDKRHCFRMGGEQDYFAAGTRRLVFEFRGVKIAGFICYDLRFPVWWRNTEGYDLALCVANWPQSRRDVWETLLKARAIENQCFVAGVNCVGKDDCGLDYSGDSMIVDPWGKIMASGREGREEIVTAGVDLEGLRKFRKKFPVLDDRDQFRILDVTE